MMNEVKQDQYTFIGPKARASAGWYQNIIDRGYDGDITWLVWDSAHKFGSRVIGPNFVSYRHGLVYGSNAEEAAEFFDGKWKEAFDQCQEFQRRLSMSIVSHELLETVETNNNVTVVIYDRYYY